MDGVSYSTWGRVQGNDYFIWCKGFYKPPSTRDVEQSHKGHTNLILIQLHTIARVLQDSANLQAWAAQAQATALQHSTFQLLQGLHLRGIISGSFPLGPGGACRAAHMCLHYMILIDINIINY